MVMNMKFGVVVFPGSNCDHDAFYAVSGNAGYEVEYLWHKQNVIPSDIDCIILPGGFSYGDYLRCGAIARFSPIMNEVIKHAESGKYVIGICNGFQILTETGLLPGTLLRNNNLKFICKDVYLKVENQSSPFTNKYSKNDIIRIPIAHGDGNYFAETSIIDELESENRVIFRYSENDGNISEKSNPNGSINNIAGIISKKGNVLGMMPHPERYSDNTLGCNDGLNIFVSLANSFNN
jgi:phosphoribosylformylglycinamidine synthase